MRPTLLTPLFASVESLKGIGPRFAKFIAGLTGPLVVDLLWHIPFRVIDRSASPPIMRAQAGQIITFDATVEDVRPARNTQPARVRVRSTTGFLDLVYFHARPDFLEKTFPIGDTLAISGVMDDFQGKKQISHPDYVLPLARKHDIPRLEPVYNLTAGLPAKSLRKAIKAALDKAPELPEWIDEAFLQKRKWPAWRAAIHALHEPQSDDDGEAENPNRCRLAYDELLASQLALALTREKQRLLKGHSLASDGAMRNALLKQLPFTPTAAQERAMAEISGDMDKPERMLRLLQGDVGSGKTLVALSAMLQAVEAGAQACLMVPTEILAQQHAASITKMLGDLPVRLQLLSGKMNAVQKREALAALSDGRATIIIGTHALFQDDVVFHDLGLVVVDEQHRFGVHQRLALSGKGHAPDLLVMTATPIPRTLTLTFYGDMDVSRLDEKPVGRKPIDTRALPLSRVHEVAAALSRKIKTGEKIYWVCPLVEESEVSDLAAATERYDTLKRLLHADQVVLLHGRMKTPEREAAMRAFKDGPASVLVATTVIEVGVDVPNATLIVIEHAERFGLAQLHQLRGRVGRSDKSSICLLLYAEPLGAIAKARLETMRQTSDGFVIAEEDLKLRGPGEILGTRQSGAIAFKLANLVAHHDLLLAARDDAKLVLSKDPHLETPRGRALRHLLYLFQYDRTVKTLRSG